MSGYMHVSTGALGGQRRLLDSLELELQVAVNFPEDAGDGTLVL